jgi:hypothetical protein
MNHPRLLTENGKKSRFRRGVACGRLPRPSVRAHTRPVDQEKAARNARKKRRAARNPGKFELTSFSFLPTTFTTLFFLAASLLLGYM